MHTCGETAYHADFMGIASSVCHTQKLAGFLSDESNLELTQENIQERLKKMRKKRATNNDCFKIARNKLRMTSDLLERWRCDRTMVCYNNFVTKGELYYYASCHVFNEIDQDIALCEESLRSFLEDRDSLLLKIVLRYFSVLVTERRGLQFRQ